MRMIDYSIYFSFLFFNLYLFEIYNTIQINCYLRRRDELVTRKPT